MADQAEAYLERLSDRLGLPEPWATEVRAEVAAHLADAIAEGHAAGLDDAAAATEAMARLGSPEALADDLRAAHQTRRRLLAGIAGGAAAAIGNGIVGTIFGWMLVLVLGMAGAVAVATVGRLTGVRPDLPSVSSVTWEGELTALALVVGAFLAGRAAVRATSARSRRATRAVVAGWSVAGAVLLAVWLVFAFRTALDGLVVATELLVPVAFALGATVGADRSGPRRARVLLAVAALASCTGLLGLLALGGVASQQLQAVGGGPYASMDDLWHAQGLDPLGRPTPESMQGVFGDSSVIQENGVVSMAATVVDAGALRGWSGLTFETWRDDPQTIAVLAGQTRPFATAPARLAGSRLEASMRVDGVRDVDTYVAVLAGVGPDGERYVLVGPNGLETHFRGTIWDWLTAPG